jgi:hypothetical protein
MFVRSKKIAVKCFKYLHTSTSSAAAFNSSALEDAATEAVSQNSCAMIANEPPQT